MGSKWRRMKLALGLNLCTYLPRTLEESPTPLNSTERLSDAALLSPLNWPMTPTPSSYGLKLSRNSSKSSKTCSICLTKMKEGGGHAIFTAECSHSFHFHCIASNVKHGNQVCPVCRAKWKEIPMQQPTFDLPYLFARSYNNDAAISLVHRLPTPRRVMNQGRVLAPEPLMFNDDEPLEQQLVFSGKSYNDALGNNHPVRMMDLKIYPEVSAVPRAESREKFDVLVHLRAAAMVTGNADSLNNQISRYPRAPIDLVTVLDISGSMAGTKLALLKRAMGFVIQNLGSNDRLSVIAFSSTARRLFPLTQMSDAGRHIALQAVNSLVANGGTNIAEGLKKSVKVMEDRRDKNPVASIILLSDGRDTYTMNQPDPNYKLLLPLSMHGCESKRFQIPVHSFGFGSDHDASLMHSVSETSGGTFSFIESESVIQDALAQCIGGLLSVAVQELRLEIDGLCLDVHLSSIKTGSYPSLVTSDGRSGCVDIGDLYADEERDFLISINIPAQRGGNETPLLKMRCVYKDLLTKEIVTLQSHVLKIQRPETVGQEVDVSIEVDRQRNRFLAAEAMVKARALAEGEDLAAAVTVIQSFRQVLGETVSAKSGDGFCVALDRELKEMQERMASRHVYEVSGRAYILSGLSSHSWQRATSRGESGDGSSFVQAYYQTPSMVEMLNRSQATSHHRVIQPLISFASQPKPR
ncbi:E3 ubiquitin-protein ligase WAV3 [Cardamine amara subsp. amara]|uniref:E3 ubiquitin-protein ligase WAV3 n=1 Tax=Cardamine amara subsp. amara TaxID=228776 RepID=A0ABD0ZFA4_CARAN